LHRDIVELTMSTEAVANLWSFVNCGRITEVGVRLYIISGTDDEKMQFLKVLAPYDFCFAARFAVPYRLRGMKLQGFEAAMGQVEYLDFFRETWDPIRESLPVHRLGIVGKSTAVAPFDSRSLLHLYTAVKVDSTGGHCPYLPNQQLPADKSKLVLNSWTFADSQSSKAFAVAGRPYMAAGDNAHLNGVLRRLAPDDYLLASRLSVPDSFAGVSASDLLCNHTICTMLAEHIECDLALQHAPACKLQLGDAVVNATIVVENEKEKVGVRGTVARALSTQEVSQLREKAETRETVVTTKKSVSWWKRLLLSLTGKRPRGRAGKTSFVSSTVALARQGGEVVTTNKSVRSNWSLQQYAQAIAAKVISTTPCEDSGLESHRALIRKFGEEIDKAYGFEGMQTVWYAIHHAMGGGPCSDLTRIWDGVGRWQK
jgi:hypothetical protein